MMLLVALNSLYYWLFCEASDMTINTIKYGHLNIIEIKFYNF